MDYTRIPPSSYHTFSFQIIFQLSPKVLLPKILCQLPRARSFSILQANGISFHLLLVPCPLENLVLPLSLTMKWPPPYSNSPR